MDLIRYRGERKLCIGGTALQFHRLYLTSNQLTAFCIGGGHDGNGPLNLRIEVLNVQINQNGTCLGLDHLVRQLPAEADHIDLSSAERSRKTFQFRIDQIGRFISYQVQ